MLKKTDRITRTFILVFLFTNLVRPSYWTLETMANKAVVTVPVADCTTEPFVSLFGDSESAEKSYQELACGPESSMLSCPRGHQIIFNEVVEITQELGEEVECKLNNVFYQNSQKEPINKFWTLKKNLKFLTSVDDIELVPQPYSLNLKDVISSQNLITLILPWQDPISKKIYSIGTRLVHCPELDRDNKYGTSFIDQEGVITTFIPKEYAVLGSPDDSKEKMKLFRSLLQKWTADLNVIAYVWGGCSCNKTYNDKEFVLNSHQRNGESVTCWRRPDANTPYSGVDCSGLILRASQIAGLPYFFKNTTTLANNLPELKDTEMLEDGDILFHRGHVIVLSSISENEITESVGYGSGYGKVHVLKLSDTFKGINNYDELVYAYLNKLPLRRIKLNGELLDIPEFKLLKLNRL